MLLVSRTATELAKDSEIEKLAMELMKTNSVMDIALSLAARMIDERETPKKIVVSQAEMDLINSIFRVRGINEDGTPVRQGRPRRDSK
jgi:hypothetical protein